VENVLFILALLVIGKGLSRLSVFPRDTFTVLANFIIYISLPALILVRFPKLEVSSAVLGPLIMPWAMLAVSAALVLLLARARNWSRSTTGALLLVVPLGNTSFLGIPMIEQFFGPQALPYALLYDQFGTFLALATYGSFVVAVYAGKEAPTLRGIATRVVTFPPFLAMLFALATRAWPYPPAAMRMLGMLEATLVPVVMIAVGFRMVLKLPKQALGPLGAGLGIKLAVAPLLALGCCRLLGWDNEPLRVAIMEAGMPPQITGGAVAIAAGLDPELASAMVGYGILLSFVTLPALHALIMM